MSHFCDLLLDTGGNFKVYITSNHSSTV
jgi:hypothetical protein